MLNRCKINNKD